MTLEQSYQAIRAEFIQLSKAIHLGYNTYDPLFTVAADAVRSVFKAEPIAEGRRRTTEENTAAVALTAIMRDCSDVTNTKLAKMLLKKCHSAVGFNMRKHWQLYETNHYYMAKWIEALQIVNDSDLCNT